MAGLLNAGVTYTFHRNPLMVQQVIGSAELRNVFLMLALRVEREARLRAPVDTGRLRNSITHRIVGTGYAIVAEIGTDVEYAVYQEFGTAHTPATRFLGSALQAVAQQLGGTM